MINKDKMVKYAAISVMSAGALFGTIHIVERCREVHGNQLESRMLFARDFLGEARQQWNDVPNHEWVYGMLEGRISAAHFPDGLDHGVPGQYQYKRMIECEKAYDKALSDLENYRD
jgi:hypothetical protein